jgi:hypothetical protein
VILAFSVELVEINLIPVSVNKESCVGSSRVDWIKLSVQICLVVISIIAFMFIILLRRKIGLGILKTALLRDVRIQPLHSFLRELVRASSFIP